MTKKINNQITAKKLILKKFRFPQADQSAN